MTTHKTAIAWQDEPKNYEAYQLLNGKLTCRENLDNRQELDNWAAKFWYPVISVVIVGAFSNKRIRKVAKLVDGQYRVVSREELN